MNLKLWCPVLLALVAGCFGPESYDEPKMDRTAENCGWIFTFASGRHAGTMQGPLGVATQSLHEGQSAHIIYLSSQQVNITVTPFPETSESGVIVTVNEDGAFYVPGDGEPVMDANGNIIGNAPPPPTGELLFEDHDWYIARP